MEANKRRTKRQKKNQEQSDTSGRHIKLSDFGRQMKETHKQPRNRILKLQATVKVQTVNWHKQQIEKQREKDQGMEFRNLTDQLSNMQ